MGNETKMCKHCQTEIPKKAKICPNCRKKQGGIAKWIAIAVVILAIIGAAAGGGEGEQNEQKQSAKIEEKENESKESGKAEKTEPKSDKEESEEENENNELKVGDSFEKSGLKITINDASLEYSDYSDEYGLYTPADGMKYIMVSFTFENTGNSDAYVSIYDFNCYADNTACEQAYLPDDSDFINTNLSSGRNISFQTYYSVPVNAQSIELEYETNIWSGEKAVIKLQ